MQSFTTYVKNNIITSILLVINLTMVIIMLKNGGFEENLIKYGGLVPFLVTERQEYYRLVMSMFLHANLLHFLSNAIVLFFLGSNLERILGPFRYVVLYFFSGIVSSLTVLLFSNPLSVTIGASGAIFGVMGALLILSFTKPRWFSEQGIKSIRQLMVLNLVFTFIVNQISVEGHLGGLVGGSLIIYFLTPKIPYYIRKHPVFIEHQKRNTYDA